MDSLLSVIEKEVKEKIVCSYGGEIELVEDGPDTIFSFHRPVNSFPGKCRLEVSSGQS